MSGQIFISYRREDSSASAGRLSDRLSNHFPSNQIFMDVDSVDLGEDFVKTIEKTVESCDVLIAVIGKGWLTSCDQEGQRRLDNSEDFVRIEIATALKRDIRVIPVLVDGASMPGSRDLPDDLKALVRRNALQLSHDRFRSDSERLASAVERTLEKTAAERRECEEKERLEAERRETEANERLGAERRQKEEQDRLEAERCEQKEQERLEALRRQREREEKERLEPQSSLVLESKQDLDTRPELPTLAEKDMGGFSEGVEPGQTEPVYQPQAPNGKTFRNRTGRIIILLIVLMFLSMLGAGILYNGRTPEGRSQPLIESLTLVAAMVAVVCEIAVVVCSIGWVGAMLSGWRRIYNAYPARKGPLGKRFATRGSIGALYYFKSLIAYVDPEGLRLSAVFPFGFAHPPIFIPWTAINRVESRRFLWLEYIKFDVGSPKVATICLPRKVLAVSPLVDRSPYSTISRRSSPRG